jgi:hypothetical protein
MRVPAGAKTKLKALHSAQRRPCSATVLDTQIIYVEEHGLHGSAGQPRSDHSKYRAKASSRKAREKNWLRICSGLAPKAMRTPISRRRWATP